MRPIDAVGRESAYTAERNKRVDRWLFSTPALALVKKKLIAENANGDTVEVTTYVWASVNDLGKEIMITINTKEAEITLNQIQKLWHQRQTAENMRTARAARRILPKMRGSKYEQL